VKHLSESYTEALLIAAKKLGCAEQVRGDMPGIEGLVRLCAGTLTDPRVKVRDAASMFREALDGKVCALSLEFTVLLITRNKLKNFADIALCYEQLYEKTEGRRTVRIRMPFEPDAETLGGLEKKLARSGIVPGGEPPDIDYKLIIDKNIIGGFIANHGDYQIDGSIKTAVAKVSRISHLN
jgi:F0F1-type ATP synthase delta subunit